MLAEATQSTMVIFDNELSPGNIRALEEIIGLPVLDRQRPDSGHFRPAGADEGRPASGGAGAVQIPAAPTVRHGHVACPGWAAASAPAAPARRSWKPTGGTSAERIDDAGGRAGAGAPGARRAAASGGRRTPCRWWPLWATPTRESPPCSTSSPARGFPPTDRLFDTLDTTTRSLARSPTSWRCCCPTPWALSRSCPTIWWTPSGPHWRSCEFADLLLHVIDDFRPRSGQSISPWWTALIAQLAKRGDARCIDVLQQGRSGVFRARICPWGRETVCHLRQAAASEDGRAAAKPIASALDHAAAPYRGASALRHGAAWWRRCTDGAQVKQVDYTPDGIEVEAVVRRSPVRQTPGSISSRSASDWTKLSDTHPARRSGIRGKEVPLHRPRLACGHRRKQALANICRSIKKKHYERHPQLSAPTSSEDGAVRFSDDGEPGGTAGMPMLQVLQRERSV